MTELSERLKNFNAGRLQNGKNDLWGIISECFVLLHQGQ
jgi:hypothetical protein